MDSNKDTKKMLEDEFVDADKEGEGEDEDESATTTLLLPPRRGGMAKTPKKKRGKVQWNDRTGNKLVEILEFQPSDASDSDDEDLDSCMCTIM